MSHRVEAAAVVFDHRDRSAVFPLEEHADARRPGVLDDVRERLLDHAVQRRLHLVRQTPVSELRLQFDLKAALLAQRLRQPLDCGDEAEVVERRGAQLDREAAHVLQRPDDELAQGADRLPRLVALRRLLERLQPEQDRGQRLSGLVVQLTRQARPLELLRLDDTADDVAADQPRVIDRDRGAPRERLGEPEVVVGEGRRGAALVVGDHDADRLAAHDERHVERRVDAEPACDLLVDLGSSRIESTRSLRPRSSTRPAFERSIASSMPATPKELSPSAAAIRSDSPSGSAIRTSRASTSSCKRRATMPSSGSSSSSDASALPISFSDSSWRSQRVELS